MMHAAYFWSLTPIAAASGLAVLPVFARLSDQARYAFRHYSDESLRPSRTDHLAAAMRGRAIFP